MKPSFQKAPAKTQSAPKGDANNPPSKPTHSLKFKDANGEYVQICNLFTNVSKAGETYLKGKDENGQQFFVMARTPKKED
jgi:hypothetical protein